ncbi:exodeoxyribonuclease V subunit alpha [Thiococcus pfennigii]|uniref:exodeoxyribonuclease V subunit alpha n=1 Tax=Thiococcus pfennigii TaxID=1057 RepID=UPI001906528B|nr:exodeoxyribonuclease V subunit alpha [Thiococcus pfennigii]
MSDELRRLMETGRLAPLGYYFARFVARGSGAGEGSLLALSAALVSQRNLQGDVCVDLAEEVGRPLFDNASEGETDGTEPVAVPLGPALGPWLADLAASPWVGGPGAEAPLILDRRRLYLGKYWHFEQQVAAALRARLDWVAELDRARLAEGLARLFDDGSAGEVDWQRVAAAVAVARRFAVISGGPGTGKTTTVVKVLALLLEQDPRQRIALAAPTGKAAARLTEAVRGRKGGLALDAAVLARIPEEASTIHRLLGFGRDGGPRYGRDNPLPLDCLVVDEASMLDLPLTARLLAALPAQARLILLGDRDQLASVEAGNVLGDITGHGQEIRYGPAQVEALEALGAAPAGRLRLVSKQDSAPPPVADAVGLLRVSHRFRAESGIGALAARVNVGAGEAALALLDDPAHEDIDWLDARPDGLHPACIAWAAARYGRYLREPDVAVALRTFESARVLAAVHRGPFGVAELNRAIAARLQVQGLIAGGDEYHGKPVMVTTNDYEVGLFNGDIGLLWRDPDGALRAYFPLAGGQVRRVSVRQLPEHACAYALTVHKSQGSELDEVLLVLPHEPGPVVTRELIYTGITRARQRVTIQGHRAAFLAGCRKRVRRASALAERLGWGRIVTDESE